MAKEKKDDVKRQTKAGMLEKNSDETAGKKDNVKSKKDPENMPKISKEKAEGHHDDKPVH
jgi:hypothetical protein